MAGSGGYGWSRKLAARMRTLRSLVRDTQRALNDVSDILNFDPEIQIKVHDIGNLTTRSTALVILGTSASARVRLLHCLLGRRLLPDPMPRGCRWLRIQYGSTTQVHVSLGNSEFEMVEELESNKRTWDTLPIEDLLRQEQTDLATVLEVELNIPFLKNGLTILFPPDVESVVDSMNYSILKQTHSELYTKRDAILRNSNPVYLYALDRTGKNIFSEPYCVRMSSSKSDDDFWTTFDLYRMTNSDNSVSEKVIKNDEVVSQSDVSKERGDVPYVFNAENCLDLHQIKEISPNSQLFFILLSNSVDVSSEEHRGKSEVEDSLQFCGEATESTEDPVYDAEDLPESDRDLMQDGVLRHTRDSPEHSKKGKDNRRLFEEQVVFMNELLEQWEFMSNPPPKHYVKSQCIILDDFETLSTIDQKGLSFVPNAQSETFSKGCKKETDNEKTIKSRSSFLTKVVKFATEYMHSYMLEYCTKLSEIHVKLLQQFILASFDLARELQVVPKKIQYVAKQEQQLYETINEKFSEGDKKQELVQIMQEVLQEMKTEINNMDWSVDDLPWHQDPRFTVSNSVFSSSCRSSPVSIRPQESVDRSVDESADQSEVEEAESYDGYNFDDYDIIHSNDESLAPSECLTNKVSNVVKDDDALSLSSQIGLIHIENENEMFSLSSSTRRNTDNVSVTTCTNTINMSAKQASLDVQQTVLSKLSRKISLKLVKFVDCLRDTYFGTLQRCIESLEWCCRSELGGRPASEAVRRLLSCARCVQLRPDASFSLLRTLLDSLRRLLYTLRIVGGEAAGACCYLSPVWRRKIANNTIHSLSPQRLARVISAQILERLSVAHERYQSALSSLEVALANRLHHTEDVKLAIRKKYAPSFARLCLESTSICDLLMYGTPDLGPEIGRGQYGVVYSVRGSWAGHSPAAVKSVLPADERHYHELAMEFFYTRSIPAHPRIVRLYGSIVQRHGGGPSVLLVSGRYSRDLHSAVRTGLTFATRMRISCDIVEGIRYLHSLGLVHRDITMKNVLLDANDRAALSDLGFCTAEALMSGSIVGTPVHMAPELFAGEYDAAVDVYAFGILFWFVCAGNIRLPSAFEACQKNKEQLWSRVRKGLRPERLPYFTDECWSVMESCWASEPSQRAHLGDIQPTLERILEQASKREHVGDKENSSANEHSDIDSMDFNEFANCI